jgi:hypothetical protein
LGWVQVKKLKPATDKTITKTSLCSFTVGVEKYLAMEMLFYPEIAGINVFFKLKIL